MLADAVNLLAKGLSRGLARWVALGLLMPALAFCQQTGPGGAASPGGPQTYVDMTPAELIKRVPELKHLEFAQDQELLPLILQRVGATVADFFDNFSNTTCTEDVLSTVHNPHWGHEVRYDRRFNYIALVKPGADKTVLEETRSDPKGQTAQLGGAITTIGFVALAAHFEPDFQRDSRFRYLGREPMKGQSTYVMVFAQRPEVARQTGRVVQGDRIAKVFVQGVAWIEPETFRILRLRTDLEQPELQIDLQRESTDVRYSAVTFTQGNKTLWLPREVNVSGQWGNMSFHNLHHYSDYRLFLVQTEEKQKNP